MRYKRLMVGRTEKVEFWWDGSLWLAEFVVPPWEAHHEAMIEALGVCAKVGYSNINQAVYDRALFRRCLVRLNDYYFMDPGQMPNPSRWIGLPTELLERAALGFTTVRGGELPSKPSGPLFAPVVEKPPEQGSEGTTTTDNLYTHGSGPSASNVA